MRILVVTSQWPDENAPARVPFIVREVEALRRQNIDLDVFAFTGGIRPWHYFRAWRSLQKVLNNDRYDLLHVQFGQSGLVAIFRKQLPIVTTFQGSDLNGVYNAQGRLTFYGFILRKISQLVASRSDQIILVSGQLAKFLPPSRTYSVIPGGIDLDLFCPMNQEQARDQLKLVQGRKYILFTGGRNNIIKRFELAKQAVSMVTTPDTELLVANNVSPEQMPVYMNAADVLLITSSREGSPNVVKESLACNLPIVSVDVGDVSERIGSSPDCAIAENDHPAAIAHAIDKILEKDTWPSVRHLVEQLDLDSTAQRIIEVYREVLSSEK